MSRPCLPSARPRAGFSLVELLVTLVVLAVIMGATVTFFRGQNQSFIESGERLEVLQNGRYAISEVDRVLRTLGAGVAGNQPMLVHGADDVIAFNTDFVETDTTDSRWAVNFNPDATPTTAVAWDAASAGPIPNSSYHYPPVTYRQPNGTRSQAETRIFWFAPDSTTTRSDDYILWERTNDTPGEIVARNLLPHPNRPFFEYFLARRLETGADTMIIAEAQHLPLQRQEPSAGDAAPDSARKVRPDSVRAIRINLRVTNGRTGADERTRLFSQIVRVPNNGLPSPLVCGRPPLPPTVFSVMQDTLPGGAGAPNSGSGNLILRWTRSPDHGAGEADVGQYVVYRREAASPWADPLINVKADTTAAYTILVGGQVPGLRYEFAVAAQDCTPAASSLATASEIAP